MENKRFTRGYYVDMWASIMSVYQYWGVDLTTLLKNINKTNPIVEETFGKMYEKGIEGYEHHPSQCIKKVYQKLDSLILPCTKFRTKLIVKALNRKNKALATPTETRFRLKRVDLIIAILCFMEEFALLPLQNEKVSSNKNILVAHSEAIDIFVEKNNKKNETIVRITIPCELCIEYYCTEKV